MQAILIRLRPSDTNKTQTLIRLRILECYFAKKTPSLSFSKREQRNIQHSCFEPPFAINPPQEGKKKLGELVNIKNFSIARESDFLDVGMVAAQKARKQGTVLLQWVLLE